MESERYRRTMLQSSLYRRVSQRVKEPLGFLTSLYHIAWSRVLPHKTLIAHLDEELKKVLLFWKGLDSPTFNSLAFQKIPT